MEAIRFLKRQVRKHPQLAASLEKPSSALTVAIRRARLRTLYRGLIVPDRFVGPWLADRIETGTPSMVGKLGTLEFELLKNDQRRTPTSGRPRIPPELRRLAFVNVGLFPVTDDALWSALDTIRDAMQSLDATAVYGHAGERRLLRVECPNLRLAGNLGAFEPWSETQPWTRTIANRRILVIHPFTDTITAQYNTARSLIWPKNRNILPPFELRTIRMPLSPGIRAPQESSWASRLELMKSHMEREPFDVALIGAGGMSLPLAAHAKQLGAIGIHLGGSTQVLFGIRGRRWDTATELVPYFNDNWVRPRPEETPSAATDIEGGCYW